MAACADRISTPLHQDLNGLRPGLPSRSFSDEMQISPEVASGSVGLGGSTFMGHFPQSTRVIRTASGHTTIRDGLGDTFDYGLGGHPNDAGGTVTMVGKYTTQADVLVDTVDVSGDVYLTQQAPSRFSNELGNVSWSWSGNATGSLRRLDAQLAIQDVYSHTQTEIAMPWWGASVNLGLIATPSGVGFRVDSLSWEFVPDDGSPVTPACGDIGPVSCRVTATKSGTVHVKGQANAGPYIEAQAIHITVPLKPEIHLAASKTTVAAGDTILITTTFKNASDGRVSQYTYNPPSGATGTCVSGRLLSCKLVPTQSGYIKVKGSGANVINIFDSLAITVGTTRPKLTVSCLPAAVVRGTRVSCNASMSDSSSFTLIGWHSTIGALTISDSSVNATGTRFEWAGKAVAGTHVAAYSSVEGIADSAAADFGITRRTTFTDADQPATSPQMSARGQPIMLADYPGLTIDDSRLTLLRGGLGRTLHLFPDYNLEAVPSGPNARLVFVSAFTWNKPIAGKESVEAGTYISAALFPSDPFYKAQKGGGDYCKSADMDLLRSEVHQHELIHYKRLIEMRQQRQLHDIYEGAVRLSPDGTAENKLIAVTFNRLGVYQFFRDMLASDLDVDKEGTTTVFQASITCDLRQP